MGGPLVGHRERGEPIDLVAPEIDAHGMVVGGRVHVDDRPADGNLAARLHLVLAPVAARHQRCHELVAVELVARPHHDRLHLLHVRAQPLHEGPDGRNHHGGCAVSRTEAPEHPEAATHRLERRRHPLERQRLPGREQLDRAESRGFPAEELREVASQPFGLRAGRDGQEQWPACGGPGERGDEQRPGCFGHRHRGGAGDDGAHRRLLGEHRRERGEGERRCGVRGGHENATKTRIPRGTRASPC